MTVSLSIPLQNTSKWGRTGFDGDSEAVVACRGSARPLKTGRKHLSANNYDYALAA